MKQLFFVRHAKTIRDDSFKDFDRTLTAKGTEDAHLIGLALHQKNIKPQLAISSPALRAISTALIICEELKFPLSAIRLDSNLYESSVKQYLQIIQKADNALDTLFLFAHNPTITDVCNLLATDFPLENMPTAGVVGLSFETDSWKNIKASKGNLILMDYPKAHY